MKHDIRPEFFITKIVPEPVDVTDMLAGQPVDYSSIDLAPGAVLRTTWNGQEYTVSVVEPTGSQQMHKGWWRYIYEGERYKTLSAVARKITGNASLSGNRFFKLRRRRR